MSNELYQPDGGELQPYQPGTALQPIQPADDWGETSVDYLDDRHERAFGQLDPAVEQNVAQIAAVFANDFANLGYVMADINKIISYFKSSLASPVTRMPAKRHSYNTWQFSNDPAFHTFCNWAATQRFDQQLISNVAYWLQQLDDMQHGVGRFANQNAVRHAQPGTATSVEDSLSDADFAKVQAINEQAAARTDAILRDTWGSSYAGNMRVLQQHWNKLSTQEQEMLSQYTTGWIKGTNTPEVLTRLFAEAIGSRSIPTNSVDIAREIASYEHLMRTDRKLWLKSDDLQARYRTLLNIRDGGR